MYSAVDVAWKMLLLAKNERIQLSHLQLQKLVYIAHGYFLGWKYQPLVKEPIEAWAYGPVIASIYHEFKQNGDSPINLSNDDGIETELDADIDAVSIVKGVLRLYGEQDALALVNLTHQRDTPWDIAWNEQGGNRYSSYGIDNELIKNHYRKVIETPDSVNGL